MPETTVEPTTEEPTTPQPTTVPATTKPEMCIRDRGYAMQSGIPYGTAFVKNAYVGRTFIKPQQKSRESSVRVKLNVLKEAVNGKRVVMIDDSIVRGTTSDRKMCIRDR